MREPRRERALVHRIERRMIPAGRARRVRRAASVAAALGLEVFVYYTAIFTRNTQMLIFTVVVPWPGADDTVTHARAPCTYIES